MEGGEAGNAWTSLPVNWAEMLKYGEMRNGNTNISNLYALISSYKGPFILTAIHQPIPVPSLLQVLLSRYSRSSFKSFITSSKKDVRYYELQLSS